jgi:hypothetical protein
MSRRIGSLHEWLRFLDAKNDDDAAAELAMLSRHIDVIYSDLSALVVRLFESPTGEVADVLILARTALAEAAGMLDSVRGRFDAGERETA